MDVLAILAIGYRYGCLSYPFFIFMDVLAIHHYDV